MRGTMPRSVHQDPQDWAEFRELCRASDSSTGEQVNALVEFQLGVRRQAPTRLVPVLPVGVAVATSGTTSARVGDVWGEYVKLCKDSDTSVSREVRGFVRWQLGRRGARRPERLVSVTDGRVTGDEVGQ